MSMQEQCGFAVVGDVICTCRLGTTGVYCSILPFSYCYFVQLFYSLLKAECLGFLLLLGCCLFQYLMVPMFAYI
jgi:hypothetical protein